MAKKIVIEGSNLLGNLSDDWGGKNNTSSAQNIHGTTVPAGAEWGMNRGEVERFVKDQLAQLRSLLGSIVSEKFGAATYRQGTIYFYDEEGGTVINTLTLSGTIYSINVAMNVEPVFSVLTGDENKYITISPTTKAGALGEEGVDFAENYTYIVAIDTGSGYVNRFNGNIQSGGSATFDIRAFLAVGTNKVRVSVTGTESNQTKTSILTATLTSLSLNCTHSWYTPWNVGEDYVINNIYFSGSIQKTLHVKLGDTEWTKTYRANENYATIATNYTIPASAFPASSESGVYTVELWMTGEGVSTEHISFNIMCVMDDTPLVTINSVAASAVNFTQATLFQFAVVNATSVEIASTISADGTYVLPSQTLAVDEGQVYTYSTALEVDTQAEDGTLTATATAKSGDVVGEPYSVTMPLDNSLAFLATSGAKIYINEALRANTESDRESFRNTAQNAVETDYPMIATGFTWSSDGHATDPEGHKAFVAAAGCSVQVPTLSPMTLMGEQGMTLEFMVRSRNIADYDTPILSFVTANASSNVEGIRVYPTQVEVLGTQERSEVLQSCGLCEDSITHICLVLQKNYAGVAGRNLASLYINGIANVSFSFGSTSTFGTGGMIFGQDKTDSYLYMLRAYDFPLEGQMVKANFLNAIIDGVEFDRELVRQKDNILDGATVAYDLVKALGYNCMVIEPDNDGDNIPSFVNQTTIQCSVRFEYWGVNPLWNVLIKHVPLDGQGTTSKKYYRWNLRGKFAKTCEWYYSDGNGDYQTVAKFTGKKGYMDGGENGQAHLKIDRFTAKKNIASSPQGHKMGACAMYDEVFAQMGLKAHMPNANWRIAVWQYPFLGFRKYSNGTYEFIGLYTAGPDKGCKSSFGYDGETYPACMCIEGPNHDPRGTRFLHPWVDVDYDYNNEETLTIGGQEAWDCDFCQYETKYVKEESAEWNAQNKANILALYETEWRPAYDLVYHCSQWIESLADTGYASVAAINADIDNFLRQSTNGVSNMLLSFYDSNYNIVYYRTSTGLFDTLIREDNDAQDGLWNIRTYLSTYLTTSTPTTAQIKAARRAKFRAEWSNFFDVDSTLAHRNYTLLTGAKDNDAKNSYPFKHLSLAQGGRWMWKQDDLDSILKTDNNGQGTVKYSVEPGDLNNGVQIFQGCDSSLWNLIWVEFQTELRNNMVAMCSAMETIARSKGIAGQYLHESVYNLMAYYFFTNSAKYFPITAYQEDRKYGYIEPWLIDPTQAYNGVYPLTQALGDRYQEERLWIERRIVYVFSKYRIGAFTGQNAGWGEMSFTLAANMPFTFNVTPAIDLYPVANAGGSEQGDVQGARTVAGETTQITLQSSGATTNYIKGVDWLQSLGDLSGLVLTSRGGSSEINFSVVSKRMQTLKVGDADSSKVKFNATTLTVSGECFEVIDARNVTTLTSAINLTTCPRLRKALFGGSTATGLLLPEGSRVNEVSFPNSVPTLFLHSIGSLTDANMTLSPAARATIVGYYFNRCPLLNPVSILQSIVDTTNNSLGYVTMMWDDTMEITTADVKALIKLSEMDFGSVTYVNGVIANDGNTSAIVRGTVHINGITEQDYDALVAAFPNLTILYDKKYLGFEDDRVWEICSYNWGETYDLQELDDKNRPMVGTYEEVLDMGTLSANTIINNANGETDAQTGRTATDFIDISDYQNVKASVALSNSAFYDNTQTYLSAANITTSYLAIPEGAQYIRLSGYNADVNSAVLTGQGTNDKTVGGHGGVVGTGTLEGGQEEGYMYSDYFFACSTAIGAHAGIPATAARTVKYRIEWEVTGATPTLEGAPWEIPAQSATTNNCLWVGQYTSAMAATALMTITAENWESAEFWASQESIISDGDGKFHTYVTCTNACQYLRVFMRAVAGVTVKFKIVSVGVTKLPSGITLAQCAAVTSLSNKFASNALIEYFNEGKYFTKCTTLNANEFQYCSNLKECYMGYALKTANSEGFHPFRDCGNLHKVNLRSMAFVGTTSSINANRSMFYKCWSLKRLILPSVTNARVLADGSTPALSLTMYDIGPNCVNINLPRINTSTGVLIMRGAPATVQGTPTWPAKIYVPSANLGNYRTATTWVNAASKIFAIGGEEWVADFGSTNEYANLTEEEYQDNYAE